MRLCRHAVYILVWLWIIASATAGAQDFQVESSVDRTEIAAGESVVLTLTITQSLQSGGPGIRVPPIPPMEGLDVVSQRSAQNMQIINGVGTVQVQTVAEILPKAPGKYTIPGFSLKGPDGKVHTTKPINITVTEASRPAPSDAEAANTPDETEERGGVSLARGLAVVGGVILLVVLSPLAISFFFSLREKQGSPRFAETEADGLAGSRPAQRTAAAGNGNSRAAPQKPSLPGNSSERPSKQAETATAKKGEAVMTPVVAKSIDFDAELIAIKRRNPDGGSELHRECFDLFHRALIAASDGMNASLTPAELTEKLARRAPASVAEPIRRLAAEWEQLVYARMSPARSFAGVEQDVRAVLDWARSQEKES